LGDNTRTKRKNTEASFVDNDETFYGSAR